MIILYRLTQLNTSPHHVEWLKAAALHHIKSVDAAFQWGCIGLVLFPSLFTALPPPIGNQEGAQLAMKFWAWGDTEDEAMSHLQRLFANLKTSLGNLSGEIAEGLARE